MRFSIIMPSYNQAQFVRQAIDSIISQRDECHIEPIVIDGDSRDGTVSILDEYGASIRYVSEPDRGQADALNKGLAMATGDVIGWLNSDDLYEPGCLARVAHVFENEPQTHWVYGKVRIVNENGREIRHWITRYKNARMRRFGYRKLLAENWISQMGVFWRREAGEQVGPFRSDLRHAMDYDYWLRLAQRWPGRFIDDYLAAFRWYATSKSGAEFFEQTGEAFEVAAEAAKGQYKWPIVMHRLLRLRVLGVYSIMRLLRTSSDF